MADSPQSDLLATRAIRFIRDRDLLHPGPLLVAVSGGQDSLAMLDILREAAPELGLKIRVAHLNHSFRGEEAAEEAVFVQEMAALWGLTCEIAAIDVPSYRTDHRLSKQVAARYARLQFLVRAAAAHGADQIALGHTADDTVETLLLNLLRGTGLTGLAGIVPSRAIQPGQMGPYLESRHWLSQELPVARGPLPRIARPVLLLSRADTAAYCRARSLPFRTDPSNEDLSYGRNWVRRELIPLLESHSPGTRDRLAATAELLADDREIIGEMVDRLWREQARSIEGRVEFDLDSWSGLGEPFQRYLLRRALEFLAGSLEDIERVHLDSLVRVIRSGKVGSVVELPRYLHLEKGYGSFWLADSRAKYEGSPALPAEPIPLQVPGVINLPSGVMEAAVAEVAGMAATLTGGRPESAQEAHLDAGLVGHSLEVRRRRQGDRFVPLGMTDEKKLQDFLVDQKVPRRERDAIPIVTSSGSIVWVAGHRIDERYKVTDDTKSVLILKFRR